MTASRSVPPLYVQVLIAIGIGVLIGHFYPHLGVSLKPVGDGFIRLIKMMIGPVIFCSLVTGIAGMEHVGKVGRVGVKAILYFEVISTLALAIGLLMVNLLQPGAGMHANPAALAHTVLPQAATAPPQDVPAFILHIIPENIIDALAKNDLLQILLFSVLFGFGLTKIGPRAAPLLRGLQSASEGLFAVIGIIMRLAPLGALGAMAYTVGALGLQALQPLLKLMGVFYLSCILFVAVVLGLIMKLAGFSLWKLIRHIKEELLTVLGTSSSESALPGLMNKLETAGCSRPVVSLVVPTGYSFNLDGTSIYLTMAAVFIAQAMDVPLPLASQLSLLLVLIIASKGAAGVTGSGFITLAAVLPTLNYIPVTSLALILGIDRFMSEGRALTNITGNAVATVVIAKWEKEIDPEASKIIR